jgi:hypothetical protein
LKVQRLTPETSAKKNIMETRESHTQWSEDIVRYSLEMRRVQNKESVCNEMQDKEGNESFKLGRIKPSSDGLADCKVTSRDFLAHNKTCIYKINSNHSIYLLKRDFEHFKKLVLPYMRQELLYKLSLNHVNLGKSGDR